MKQWVMAGLTALMVLAGAVPAAAAEVKVSSSQVRLWIGPEGAVRVNEIHTYEIPEGTGEVLRDFTYGNHENVIGFRAGEVDGAARVGEVEDDEVRPVAVQENGTGWELLLDGRGGKRTFLLSYLLEDALKVYDGYSDLEVGLFSSTSYEFEGLRNLEVSVILPGNAGAASIRPYTRNMNGSEVELKDNGVIFRDPIVEEPLDASYRVFFPSGDMTEAVKSAAPVPLEEAVKAEEERFTHAAAVRGHRETFEKAGFPLALAFILAGLVSLAVPQRLPITRRDEALILSLDLVYLHFVRWAGRFTPRAADAMLYGLLEKGAVSVTGGPDAKVWEVKGSTDRLEPHEQLFIRKLFRDTVGRSTLGPRELESDRAEKALREWHGAVLHMLEEAGTMNLRIPKRVLLISALVPTAAAIIGAVVAAMPAGWLAAFLAGIIVFLYVHMKKMHWRWLAVVYGVYLTFGVAAVDVPGTGAVILLFVIGYLLVWLFFPRTLLVSRFAYRVKYAINRLIYTDDRFRLPDGTPEERRLREHRVHMLAPKFRGLARLYRDWV
ncbi:hypothetical protein C772_01708 [Bhargavaea cecembensis DSE10]|uniref:DUF2207 domain-containing protein n=1 Tax=Bhargavaea cecembensis DSE10 TaxID=1235279 RepID=M7NGR4_9BACL|nr:DUF2207 domain-containing protein [Bhargavaea cecembensis]EMR06437.1 hypothetical protein C772_01708 [Bhargavaea cecembensis DSE10]